MTDSDLPHQPPQSLTPEQFWHRSRDRVVLDVRSPSEFAQGHIPGASNLPLFNDAERAEIGRIYRDSGHHDAVLRGLNLVGPKMADLAIAAKRLAVDETVYVHCWRGGMRSGSFAWLLQTVGLKPVVLAGGYKAFRQLAHEQIDSTRQLLVISGLTGVGKTRYLECLADAGAQTVDLEGLANHRGSAFGSIGQPDPPTTEQFENNLFEALDRCDRLRPIWVEDEGNRLGTVVIPPGFVHMLRSSPAVFLESSSQQRVDNLVQDYGDLPAAQLMESIRMIRKRLGPQHADRALAAIDEDDRREAIGIVLDYYDRTYLHAASRMPRETTCPLNVEGLEDEAVVSQLMEIAGQLGKFPCQSPVNQR